MKKTFNLKLMLLGLMTLCSTNIWAQYTAVDGVVYGLSGDKKSATVKGVLSNLPADAKYGADLSIRIAGEVTIKTYGDGKTYTVPVTDFDEGWMHAGVYQCDPVSGSASTTQPTDPGLGDGSTFEQEIGGSTTTPTKRVTYRTVDADDVNGNDQVDQTLALVLASENLKEISRADIMADKSNVLPIAAFIVGPKSPITVIPDYLFAVCNTENVTHHYTYYGGTTTPQAALQKYTEEKTALEKLLDGDYIIKGGKFTDSKGVEHQVYKQLKDKNSNDVSAKNYYLYMTETEAGTDGQPLYTLMRINKDGTTTKLKVTARLGSAPNEDYLVNADFGDLEARRVAVKFSDNAYKAGGYIAERDAKKAALEKLVKETIPQAQKDLRDAEFYKDNPDKYVTEAIIAKRDAAIRLENAIANFEKKDPAKFADLQAKIKGEISNVEEVTPWYAAFATATNLVKVGNWWNPLITEVKEAYEAFYGKSILTIGDVVTAQAFTTKLATTANITGQVVDLGTTPNLNLIDNTITGKIQDLTEIETSNVISGYRKIRMLECNYDDWKNQIFYVKGTDADPNKYFVLFVLPAGAPAVADNLRPSAWNPGSTILLNFEGAAEYTLTRENLPTMDAADPDRDIAKAKNAATPKDWDKEVENATQALAGLNSEKGELERRIKELEGDDVEDGLIKKAQDALAALPAHPEQPESDDPTYTYLLNEDAKNETLKLVKFNNKVIEYFGDYSFYNCVKAKFSGTFPATTQYVGDEAFANTLLAKADFTGTGKIDWRGKLDAATGKISPDGVADRKDRLTEDDIAPDAFTGTPLEQALLKDTDLGGRAVKKILQSLKKNDEKVSAKACDVDIEFDEGEINNTLTTVTLPDLGEEFDYVEDGGAIVGGTFKKLWALTSVTIPTYLRGIEEEAFAYTNVPEFDLTEMIGLIEVGDGAFSYNPSLTKVLFAKKAPLTSLAGPGAVFYGPDAPTSTENIGVFAGDCALTQVVFNDAIECLGTGLFADAKLAELNLGDTQVKALNNLFLAGTGELPIYGEDKAWILGYNKNGNAWKRNGTPIYADGEIIGYYDGVPNKTLTKVELPEGLLFINSFALSNLKNENLKTIVVPSTVTQMGAGVFRNSSFLETISFINTPLTNFEKGTFEQCLNLKQVIIRTTGAVDTQFHNVNLEYGWAIPTDGSEDICADESYYRQTMSMEGMQYCFDDILFNGRPNKDPVEVVVTKDVQAQLKDWHKVYSYLTGYQPKLQLKKVGKYYWATFVSPYAAAWFDDKECVVFTAYQDGNDVVVYPAKTKGGKYKVAAFDPENGQYDYRYYQDNYGYNQTWNGVNYVYGLTDPDKVPGFIAACRASIAIVRSNKPEIEYEEKFGTTFDPDNNGVHIAPKWLSTLDDENCMRYLENEVTPSTNLNWYKFGAHGDEVGFYYVSSGKLPAGSIGLMGSAVEGLSRLNMTIIEPDAATGIQGVKEYLEGIKSGAVYNLQGVKVTTTQKGKMYIQNGKKFIQK